MTLAIRFKQPPPRAKPSTFARSVRRHFLETEAPQRKHDGRLVGLMLGPIMHEPSTPLRQLRPDSEEFGRAGDM